MTDKFELDYIGVKVTNNFNFNDIIDSDGTLKITVSANSQINNIDTTPNNKVNVINDNSLSESIVKSLCKRFFIN